MPRTLLCECGACRTCKRRTYMEIYYRRPGVVEKVRERVARYRQENVEEVRAKDRARGFRETDKQKIAARAAAAKLEKQPCEECGVFPAHAHHEDYSKPLEVEWLCPPCHGRRHRRIP